MTDHIPAADAKFHGCQQGVVGTANGSLGGLGLVGAASSAGGGCTRRTGPVSQK